MIRADGVPDPVSLGCPRPILAPYRIRATIPNDSIDVGKATGGDNERSGRGEKQRYDAQGTVAEDEIPYLSGYRNCAGWWISRGGKGMTAQNCEMMNWGGDKGGE